MPSFSKMCAFWWAWYVPLFVGGGDTLIRIVGVQRSEHPEREFLLLQNQGSRRLTLRGHGVVAESAIANANLGGAYFPTDDVLIPPGLFVLLVTGCGQNRWGQTKDGTHVYYCHMNKRNSVWVDFPGPIHLVAAQHTYVERETYALV